MTARPTGDVRGLEAAALRRLRVAHAELAGDGNVEAFMDSADGKTLHPVVHAPDGALWLAAGSGDGDWEWETAERIALLLDAIPGLLDAAERLYAGPQAPGVEQARRGCLIRTDPEPVFDAFDVGTLYGNACLSIADGRAAQVPDDVLVSVFPRYLDGLGLTAAGRALAEATRAYHEAEARRREGR